MRYKANEFWLCLAWEVSFSCFLDTGTEEKKSRTWTLCAAQQKGCSQQQPKKGCLHPIHVGFLIKNIMTQSEVSSLKSQEVFREIERVQIISCLFFAENK